MQAIKAIYKGGVPSSRVDLPRNKTVYVTVGANDFDADERVLDAETIEAMRDVLAGRNLVGPFKTAREAVASMLED
jgi:hypothetical protein